MDFWTHTTDPDPLEEAAARGLISDEATESAMSIDEDTNSNFRQKRADSYDELDTAPYTDDEEQVDHPSVQSRKFVSHHTLPPSENDTLTNLPGPSNAQTRPHDPSCHIDDESAYALYSDPSSSPKPPAKTPPELLPEWKREAKTMESRYRFLDVLLSVSEADRLEHLKKGLADTDGYWENDPLLLEKLNSDNEDRDEPWSDPGVGAGSTNEHETNEVSEWDVKMDMDIDMNDGNEVEQDLVWDDVLAEGDRLAADARRRGLIKPWDGSEIEPNSWDSIPKTRPPANSAECEAGPDSSESRILYPIMGTSQLFELMSVAPPSGPVRNPADFEVFRHPANTAKMPIPGLVAAAYFEDLCGKRWNRRRRRQRRDRRYPRRYHSWPASKA